jgi:hypothetical protein
MGTIPQRTRQCGGNSRCLASWPALPAPMLLQLRVLRPHVTYEPVLQLEQTANQSNEIS